MLVSRRRQGACVALRWNEAERRYRCGMADDPAGVLGRRWGLLSPVIRRLARRWISAGSGCDATLDAQRRQE
jgi:hypothetical protein